MPLQKQNRMPESLLWLSNELYWRQNLAPLAGVPADPQPPRLHDAERALPIQASSSGL